MSSQRWLESVKVNLHCVGHANWNLLNILTHWWTVGSEVRKLTRVLQLLPSCHIVNFTLMAIDASVCQHCSWFTSSHGGSWSSMLLVLLLSVLMGLYHLYSLHVTCLQAWYKYCSVTIWNYANVLFMQINSSTAWDLYMQTYIFIFGGEAFFLVAVFSLGTVKTFKGFSNLQLSFLSLL